jgi:hypothetical protein
LDIDGIYFYAVYYGSGVEDCKRTSKRSVY